MTSLMLLAIATSVDGFWAGFAMGIRRQRFSFEGLAIVCGITVATSAIAVLVGQMLQVVMGGLIAKIVGAAIMLALGGWVLREGMVQRRRWLKETSTVPRVEADQEKQSLVQRLLDPFGAGNHDPKISRVEATALALAVAADTAVLSMAAGIAGFNPIMTPIMFGVAHFIMVSLGNSLGRHRRILSIVQPLAALPGLTLIAIGLIRLLG